MEINNYITISDRGIVSECDNGAVTIINNVIEINENITLHIEYSSMDNFKIVINSTDVSLVEKYICSSPKDISKTIIINQNCSLKRYVCNNKNSYDTSIQEEINLYNNACIMDAIVDLSNSSSNFKFTYNLNGEYSNAKVRVGIFGYQQDCKNVTVDINHLAPYTSGIMENYGVAKDSSLVSIDGIARISKGQFQSNSHQVNKVIVFDAKAKAKANPYLFIDEHEVNASHGASVGRVDVDQLYYLQSRGLTKNEAMHLIIFGYFSPVLDYISNKDTKEEFINELKEKVAV